MTIEERNVLRTNYINLDAELRLANKNLIIGYLMEEIEYLKGALTDSAKDCIKLDEYHYRDNNLSDILSSLWYPLNEHSMHRFTVNVTDYGYFDFIKGVDLSDTDYDYTAIGIFENYFMGANMMPEILGYIKGDYNKIHIYVSEDIGTIMCDVE